MEFTKGLKGQPFGYYGGKQRMVSKILPLIPKHTVYIEPFFGGGSVFFRKPYPAISDNSHYREVINDFDERAINFFRVLQDKNKFEILQHKLFHTASFFLPTLNKLKVFRLKKFLFLLQLLGILQV